jgi:hypothetical protein
VYPTHKFHYTSQRGGLFRNLKMEQVQMIAVDPFMKNFPKRACPLTFVVD